MNDKIKIGTRGSKLALWQAHFLKGELEGLGYEVELIILKTKGDRLQHLSFDKIEGKGFFTKEIEQALLRGDVQVAVHSMKDLPTEQTPGLVLGALSKRANPSDYLIVAKDKVEEGQLLKLPKGAVVGTSSARRKAQILHYRNDVQIKDIRGNVPTRLQKLASGEFDAILLAAAGIERLEIDLSSYWTYLFNPKEFVPAPAQGVLAFQCCVDDLPTRRILKKIHQSETALVTNVERRVLKLAEGGCHMPIGVYCEIDEQENYHVWVAKAASWDAPLKKFRLSSSTHFGLAEEVIDEMTKLSSSN